MKVVTVATHADGYFDCLMMSCRRHGVELKVLGWGTEWKGFNHKLHLLCEYLMTVPAKEVVMFIDAYDVVILRDLRELEEQYEAFARVNGSKMVVSVEKYSNLLYESTGNLVFGTCRGRDLNAGTYMGHADVVLRMLHLVVNDPDFAMGGDDQRAITKVCRKQSEMVFDSMWKWFIVLNRFSDKSGVRVVDGDLVYKGILRPFVLHCPGNVDMTGILKELGYEHDPASIRGKKRSTLDYMMKIAPHQVWLIVRHHFPEIILALLVTWLMSRRRRCSK